MQPAQHISPAVLPAARSDIAEAWDAYCAMCRAETATPALARNKFWIKHRDRLWADWCKLFEALP